MTAALLLWLVLETARVAGLVSRSVLMVMDWRRPGKVLMVVVVVGVVGKEDTTRQVLAVLLLLNHIVAASARCVSVDPLERGATVIAMRAPLRAAQMSSATFAIAHFVVPLPSVLHQTTTATAHDQHLETLPDKKTIN